METAPPIIMDPSQTHFSMPYPVFLPPPSPPDAMLVPVQEPPKAPSRLLDILKIFVGLLIAIMLGALCALIIFLPRTSNQVDLRESNEKIAKLIRDSNENIARLQREQTVSIETERQKRQEILMEKYRQEDRLIEQQRFERQMSIENQRLERQYNLTEKHRSDDQSIQERHREQDLLFALQQSKKQLEIEEKRLQILLEEKVLDEQHREDTINKEYTSLLAELMQEISSATQPIDTAKLEWKVHSLLRQFNARYKSLLIELLYNNKLLYVKNPFYPTLNLQGANLKDIRLDDMSTETGQIGRWFNYTKLSLPLTSLINGSFEQIYLNEANFSRSNMAGASFRSSQVIRADFHQSNLTLSSFVNTDISQSDFSSSYIRQASFVGANLSFARMNFTSLQFANLQDSIAISTNFSSSTILYSNFQSANLIKAHLDFVSAPSTNFYSVKASYANFTRSSMPGSDFQWADLSNAIFTRAYLAGANFENANIVDTDFTGAILSGAKITPGQLDVALSIAQAILPDGSIGKNKNLVLNNDANCADLNGNISHWTSNGDVFTKQVESSTECVFQAKTPNATLGQKIDLHRYERLIKDGHRSIYLEMQGISAGTVDPGTPSAYMNVTFFDSRNNQIGLEQSLLDITWLAPASKLIASVPCPSVTTELLVKIIFRETGTTIDHIYVTVD